MRWRDEISALLLTFGILAGAAAVAGLIFWIYPVHDTLPAEREGWAREWMKANEIEGHAACPSNAGGVCEIVPKDARAPFLLGCHPGWEPHCRLTK